MSKIKKLFTNFRVILVLFFLLMAIVAINPNPFAKGVSIRSVIANSSANIAGIENPAPNLRLTSREKILAVNGMDIVNEADYDTAIAALKDNMTVFIKTNKNTYRLTTKALYNIVYLNETELKIISEEIFNNKTNKTETITKAVDVPKIKQTYLGMEDIGLKVTTVPTTNLKKGLELEGGTRVLLKPEQKLSSDDIGILIANMKERLNVYGLSDINVLESKDLSGNQYIVVEIAGANEEEVKDLISKEGKFEAKVGNTTVFIGGKKDITYVGRSSNEAGIDPNKGCGQTQAEWACRFRFAISLSPEAAKRQADTTKNLAIVTSESGSYLNESLLLYLDDVLVDQLNIGSDLKGRAVTDIEISGSGVGRTQQEAVLNALDNMKRLQTILITGSLPVKLSIVKTDNISATLGNEFLRGTLLAGLIALLGVELCILIRYRKLRISLPIITISIIEIVMLLGVAALIGWNMDLASIAGIIVAVGTGVNDQIVITDEALRKGHEKSQDWKSKIKNAFSIIMGAYLTVFVAMLPLMIMGAGMLKGFALTTIIGISIGVFITRPAFGNIIEILLKE